MPMIALVAWTLLAAATPAPAAQATSSWSVLAEGGSSPVDQARDVQRAISRAIPVVVHVVLLAPLALLVLPVPAWIVLAPAALTLLPAALALAVTANPLAALAAGAVGLAVSTVAVPLLLLLALPFAGGAVWALLTVEAFRAGDPLSKGSPLMRVDGEAAPMDGSLATVLPGWERVLAGSGPGGGFLSRLGQVMAGLFTEATGCWFTALYALGTSVVVAVLATVMVPGLMSGGACRSCGPGGGSGGGSNGTGSCVQFPVPFACWVGARLVARGHRAVVDGPEDTDVDEYRVFRRSPI